MDKNMSSSPVFVLPHLNDNESGWGPLQQELPDVFRDIPFAPFNKGDKVGKVVDWDIQQNFQQRGGRFQQYGAGTSTTFTYKHEEDEGSFQLVDNKPQKKPMFGSMGRRNFQQRRPMGWQQRGRGRGAAQGTRGQDMSGRGGAGGGSGGRGRGARMARGRSNPRGMNDNRRRWGYGDKPVRPREPSVEIQDDWKVIQHIPFAELNKLSLEKIPEAEDLVWCGALDRFDLGFEQISTRSDINLKRFDARQHFTTTTSDDPVIQSLSARGEGKIYATDTILAVLMTAPRSVYSWDIIITKEGDNIYFDKRPKSQIDYHSVNETGNDFGMADDETNINHPTQLTTEATFINHNFSQQVLGKGERMEFPEPNPFISSLDSNMEAASIGYRYRRWPLSNSISLICRTELNAYAMRRNEKIYTTVKALNEFDSKATGSVDWRQKLDSQRAAVLATELKNNANKIARWTAQALLAGADEMKIGYVSRAHPKDSYNHVILGTQRYKPSEFAQQMNFDAGRMWGILRFFINTFLNLDDGKFLLMKDPNEQKLVLYSLPDNYSFDDEDKEAEVNDEDED